MNSGGDSSGGTKGRKAAGCDAGTIASGMANRVPEKSLKGECSSGRGCESQEVNEDKGQTVKRWMAAPQKSHAGEGNAAENEIREGAWIVRSYMGIASGTHTSCRLC